MAPKASPKRANKTAKNKIMGRPFVEGDKLYLHFFLFCHRENSILFEGC